MAGSATLVNKSDKDLSLESKLMYEEEKTYTFTRSVSVTGGLKFTFEGNLLAVKTRVELSAQVTGTFEWEDETSEKITHETSVTTPVAKMSSVKVNYIGTKAKYSVPFSYTQRDVDSNTGKPIVTQHDDGIYIGLSSIDFKFEAEPPVPLKD